MRIQWTKILSKLALFFVILVGCAGVSHAQWTGLANPFPSGFAQHCLLLTDGTVMCHEAGTNRWHRLKPDINGSYQNGSWDVPGFTVANMPNGTDTTTAGSGCAPCVYAPLFFASAVLPDGRVVVIGGEYNTNGQTWTNIGFLYNPVTNTWSSQLTVPGTFTGTGGAGTEGIGDAQSVILPNGTMLLATTSGTDIASFNPATLTFTALNPTGKDDGNDEENWNILPNGRVLTVDSTIGQRSEVYNPATNAWEAAVNTAVNLADTGAGTVNSAEVGPGVLRPDGTIIYFSGTNSGLNSVYDTNTGTWTATGAAGNFPASGAGHFAVADGPATLLPNGNVLVMASPVFPTKPPGVFNTPSHFYEFDGTNLTQVADSPNAASFISYQGRFLLLPTGEVLLIAYDQNTIADLQLYSNGGSPQNAWRPVITSAPSNVNAGNTYAISGKLFNGFSEGASYGDDGQMSTNYPLVRIINHATGHVFYARTHDHSRMGVEPVGSNEIVTTQFDAPAGMESGASDLVVVANGIASQPIVINGPDLAITKTHSPTLFTQGDSGDTFSITVSNIGNSPVSGVVTVTDTLPGSLTATAINGTGWSCTLATLTCTRADALASYPPIVVTVNVANNAPILITNTATVSGGGEATTVNLTGNNTATDNVSVRQHTFTTVDAATQDYHDDVTLRATVAPTGVAGSVTFFIDGVNVGVASYSSVTGMATLVYNITQIPGPHTILAAFTSADILYLDSSGTNTLTVTREETTLSYTGDTVIANGGTATMSGVLLEDGLVPIAGRTVTFTLGSGGSAQTCNGVTDASGIATCAITPVAQPLGPGVVGDVFAGDAFYLPSSASANTIIFAFLANGAFVIGDLNAPIGTSVTFWSAQWPALNSLSGGPAPSSFKGFASTLTAEPPNCGITWTTGPGNSSDPPDSPLPSYMGILVSTRVVKSGSTVSGDVLSIVVVKTDTGYRSNPGHAGTGIVVAQFCHR
jgi:uncharacterized repeat protein (TIGR01451 family)